MRRKHAAGSGKARHPVVAGFLHVARGIEHCERKTRLFAARCLAARALHELNGDKRLHLGLFAAQQGEQGLDIPRARGARGSGGWC